jgi:hypothetical protein
VTAFGAYVGIGVDAAFLRARRLNRGTFGPELGEIAGMLRNQEAALDGLRESVAGCDAQGRITVINSAARRFLGLPAEGLEGRLAEIGLDPAGNDALTLGQEVRDEALTVGNGCWWSTAGRACAVRRGRPVAFADRGPLGVRHLGRIPVPAARVVRGVAVGVDTLCATGRPCPPAPAGPQSPERHTRTEPPAPHPVSGSPFSPLGRTPY